MKLARFIHILAATCLFLLGAGQAVSGEIRVAVASNFNSVIKHLAERFESSTGHSVILIFGSTGKHYAQIRHGAPFHAFLAADLERPKRLEEEGYTVPNSRFTYAIGHIALWSPKPGYVSANGDVLESTKYHYLAIGNPKLAPYGKAAKEVLKSKGLWHSKQARIVRGENIAQTFQFVKSGNAQLGFIAYSQIKQPNKMIEGSWWLVPQALYTPIEQQAVLLKNNDLAHQFLSFVKSEASRTIIQSYGYSTP